LPLLKGDLRIIFGNILKEYRNAKELSQQQLADFADLDRAYISELERGLLMPSLETFFKLSYQLKVKPSEFIHKIDQQFKG
jgi:transcriptional regulator with XRE-family HTH domain